MVHNDRPTCKDRHAAELILARSTRLHQRPNTLPLLDQTYPCSHAADHTFAVFIASAIRPLALAHLAASRSSEVHNMLVLAAQGRLASLDFFQRTSEWRRESRLLSCRLAAQCGSASICPRVSPPLSRRGADRRGAERFLAALASVSRRSNRHRLRGRS